MLSILALYIRYLRSCYKGAIIFGYVMVMTISASVPRHDHSGRGIDTLTETTKYVFFSLNNSGHGASTAPIIAPYAAYGVHDQGVQWTWRLSFQRDGGQCLCRHIRWTHTISDDAWVRSASSKPHILNQVYSFALTILTLSISALHDIVPSAKCPSFRDFRSKG